jgi:hypothetical protein
VEIISGPKKSSWIIMVYGVPGVGKSTLGIFAPSPVFLNLENGLDRIDCQRTPHLQTFDEFIAAIKWAKDCEYKTIVIDTTSAIEEMLVKQMLDEVNQGRKPPHLVQTINDTDAFPWGTGGQLLKSKWCFVLELLFKLKSMGKNIICISHEAIQKTPNPQGDDYDRYTPNLHKKSVDHIISQMDGVFFIHHERIYRTKKGPMGQEIRYMSDTGNRLIQTHEKLTALAKNRFGLKPILPFNSKEDCKGFFDGIS